MTAVMAGQPTASQLSQSLQKSYTRREAFQRERDDLPGVADLVCVCREHAGPRLTRRDGPTAVAGRVRHQRSFSSPSATCWWSRNLTSCDESSCRIICMMHSDKHDATID